MEDRTINFIYYLIVGSANINDLSNLWDFKPGVDYFISAFIEPIIRKREIQEQSDIWSRKGLIYSGTNTCFHKNSYI